MDPATPTLVGALNVKVPMGTALMTSGTTYLMGDITVSTLREREPFL
jgi:hypothetical protein